MQCFLGALSGFTHHPDEEPEGVLTLQQVHGSHGVCVLDRKSFSQEAGDFLWTQKRDQKIGVKVADCSALLLEGVNSQGAFVAAVHAGWRGTAAGILQRVAEACQPLSDVIVWMSPSICAEHFEVGPEVFEMLSPSAKDFAIQGKGDRWHLNLKAFQKSEIQRVFPRGTRVFASSLCTFCQSDFISYRRSQGQLPKGQRHLAWIQLRSLEVPAH